MEINTSILLSNSVHGYLRDVFDLNDDDEVTTSIDRARPHDIMDGFPVIHRRHCLQARNLDALLAQMV